MSREASGDDDLQKVSNSRLLTGGRQVTADVSREARLAGSLKLSTLDRWKRSDCGCVSGGTTCRKSQTLDS